MSYIGNPPLTGSYKKLDDISSGFNGSTTTFNLTSSSDAVTPGSPNALIISLGGVVQEPTSSYTVSGSTITFTTAPAASTTFWGVMLGDTLYVGVSQGTVTPSMLSTGGPSWDTSGNATVSGNLTFSGTAKRITGDFSNATVANRVAFQTSTANSSTIVSAIPSGTGTAGQFAAYNNSDPTNSSALVLSSLSTEARVAAGIAGTGTYLPMTFLTGGSERMRIDTSGNVGIGTSSPGYKLDIQSSSATLNLQSTTTTSLSYLTLRNVGYNYVGVENSAGGGLFTGSSAYALALGTVSAYPIQFGTNGTIRATIDSSGNVGIGTTTLNASGSTKSLAIGSSTATDYAGLEFQTAGSLRAYMNATNGAFYIASASTNPTVFYTNSSERVRITANGGVAFGGASNYGTSGQVLTSNGDAAPTWGTVSGTPAGSVVAFAGSSAPSGWLLCSGAAVSRSTYAALFAVIGTTYGAGDGSTTFNLPDMRGRSAFGVDNMGGTAANRITSGGSGITGTTLGAAGGAETVTLTSSQMPSHTHGLLFSPVAGNTTWAFDYYLARSTSGGQSFAVGNLGGGSVINTVTNQNTGSGGAHNTVPPAIILNYIIKT